MKTIATVLILFLGACSSIEAPGESLGNDQVDPDTAGDIATSTNALVRPPEYFGCWRTTYFDQIDFWNDGTFLHHTPTGQLRAGYWYQQNANPGVNLAEITTATNLQHVNSLTSTQMNLTPGGVYTKLACGAKPVYLTGGMWSTITTGLNGIQIHNTYTFWSGGALTQEVTNYTAGGTFIDFHHYTGTWQVVNSYLNIVLEGGPGANSYPYVLLNNGTLYINDTAYWPEVE